MPFLSIDRHHLDAVTGGLASTIRTRRQAPEVQQQADTALQQRLAGLSQALAGVGKQAAQPAPAASPMAGLGGLGLPTG